MIRSACLALSLCLGACDTGAAAPGIVPKGKRFSCTPERVWDGDGPIWCKEGPRIRLAGIAAREMDGTCKPGHPCPDVSAKDSRDHLAGLLIGERGNLGINFADEGHVDVEGPSLTCMSKGGAGGSRTAAWCSSPSSGDLSCAMVRDGYALRWDRYWKDHQC